MHNPARLDALTKNHILAVFFPESMLIIAQMHAKKRTVAAQIDWNLSGVNPYASMYINILRNAISANAMLSRSRTAHAIFTAVSFVAEVLVASQRRMKFITITPHISPKPLRAYSE